MRSAGEGSKSCSQGKSEMMTVGEDVGAYYCCAHSSTNARSPGDRSARNHTDACGSGAGARSGTSSRVVGDCADRNRTNARGASH